MTRHAAGSIWRHGKRYVCPLSLDDDINVLEAWCVENCDGIWQTQYHYNRGGPRYRLYDLVAIWFSDQGECVEFKLRML